MSLEFLPVELENIINTMKNNMEYIDNVNNHKKIFNKTLEHIPKMEYFILDENTSNLFIYDAKNKFPLICRRVSHNISRNENIQYSLESYSFETFHYDINNITRGPTLFSTTNINLLNGKIFILSLLNNSYLLNNSTNSIRKNIFKKIAYGFGIIGGGILINKLVNIIIQ